MDEEEYDAIFSFLEYGTYLIYPSAWHHKDLKQAQVCAWTMPFAVDIASYTVYRKKDKERGKIEYLQVPRGVEEIERILHSCHMHSSKESEYHCSARIYVYASGLGYRISSTS